MLRLFFFLCSLITLYSCQYDTPEIHTFESLTKVDTLGFEQQYHYWVRDAFVLSDSIKVQAMEQLNTTDFSTDSLIIPADRPIVILDIQAPLTPNGDYRIFVAADAHKIGWINHNSLFPHLIPNQSISLFIATFSNRSFLISLFVIAVAIIFALLRRWRQAHFQMVHFNDIKSFYPTLLCLIVSGSAVLYGAVQQFSPDTWRSFYYHPTLNPFALHDLPLILFLFSLWLMLIVGLAVIDDLRKYPGVVNALSYSITLGGVCFLLYLFFTQTVHIYIGYPLLPLYWYFAIRQHRRHNAAPYRCGQCGAVLEQLRQCPHCGAHNE